jgi:hypothetical protein
MGVFARLKQIAKKIVGDVTITGDLTVMGDVDFTGGTISGVTIADTTSTTFQIDSGNTGPKVKNNSGVVEARNADDDAYADFKAKDITGEAGTFSGSVSAGTATVASKELSYQSGSSTFAGQTGKTVSITEVMSADYHVDIVPMAESGFIGEIWISTRTVNAFVVKNSGSDDSSAFAWRISGAALA